MADGSIQTADNFFVAGHDSIVDKDYYGRFESPAGAFRTNSKNAYERYLAGEIVLKKRLSNNWMMDASVTYMDWKYFSGGDFFISKLRLPEPVQQFLLGWRGGGSSEHRFRIHRCFCQFPVDGEGHRSLPIPIWDQRQPHFPCPGRLCHANLCQSLDAQYRDEEPVRRSGRRRLFGDTRMPNFTELNFRLEKVFKIGEASTVVVAADAFNALNSNTALATIGQITPPDSCSPSASSTPESSGSGSGSPSKLSERARVQSPFRVGPEGAFLW